MKTLFLAAALAALSFSLPAHAAADATEDDCTSAVNCLQKAQSAFEAHAWKDAESLAAAAVDWAEPLDAKIALKAFSLAARASRSAGRPRMALAWSDAGVYWLAKQGPWLRNKAYGGAVPADAAPYARELGALRTELANTVKLLPADFRPTGFFVTYAGRGFWNELTLKRAAPRKVTWYLEAITPTRGFLPSRQSGPRHWSEDEEHEAALDGRHIRGTYPKFNGYDQTEKPQLCPVTLTLTELGVDVVDTPDCELNAVGQIGNPRFHRVERPAD